MLRNIAIKYSSESLITACFNEAAALMLRNMRRRRRRRPAPPGFNEAAALMLRNIGVMPFERRAHRNASMRPQH